MSQDSGFPKNISMEQAMAFAASPAGQKLLAMIQRKGGNELQAAKDLAASGNMEQAKKALSSLLSDPQFQNILKQYGG